MPRANLWHTAVVLRRSPPPSVDALLARARSLTGHGLGEIALALGATIGDHTTHTKGKFGVLLEHALGASGGSGAVHDFPALGVELKTIPVDARGKPAESTYVCTLHLLSAEALVWETSWVKQKLSRVLFVSVDAEPADWRERVVRGVHYWEPDAEAWATLRADFEEAVGLVTNGRIEALNARLGQVLQVRPKAKDGKKTLLVPDAEGTLIATVPRGFYLRPAFTAEILQRYK